MSFVRKAAEDLIGLTSEPHNLAGARGLAAGALHSLTVASSLRAAPTFSGRLTEFSEELDEVLASISRGETTEDARWLAGYHFNSALFRLSFAAERALKLWLALPHDDTFGAVIDEAETRGAIAADEATSLHRLREDVNLVKHDPTEWRQRRLKSLDDAIEVVPLVVKLLQRAGSSSA